MLLLLVLFCLQISVAGSSHSLFRQCLREEAQTVAGS